MKCKGKPTKECKACKRKRSKKSYRKNIETYQNRGVRRRFEAQQLIRKLKSEPCTDCEGKFHYCQMDFDHRDPTEKKKPISRLLQAGLATLRKEIVKCDLVCANCHRDRTQKNIEYLDTPRDEMDYRQRRLQETNDFVNSLKDGKPCADCGEPHPYWRLDFDHREGKTRTVSRLKLGSYSQGRIFEEVVKCDLVCTRCHRLRSWKRQREAAMGPT